MTIFKKLTHSGLAWVWVTVFVLCLDRASKIWAMHALSFYEPKVVLPFLNFTLTFNTGAAFSFLQTASGWQNIFLGGIAFIISVGVLIWLFNSSKKAYWMNIALCLIVGGALGNLWDRILYGHVVDFLSFHWENLYFAIFNIADSAICIGAFMMFVHWIRNK